MHRGDRVVIDASVAAKWYLPEEDDVDRAHGLLVLAKNEALTFVAPDVIWLEVGSAITVATRGRAPRLSIADGEERIMLWLELRFEIHASRDLLPVAFSLVHEHGCALYDAVYLALADRINAPFVTADRRLFQRIGQRANVIWLGDY